MAFNRSTQQTDHMLEQLESENIIKVKNALKEMYRIWNLVGVDDEQQFNRASSAWGYITDLSGELLNEEKGFYEDIKERIKNYEQKISDLATELSLGKIQVDGTLIEKEEVLRKELDKLTKLKHKRIKEFQELHSIEVKYCKLLGMPPLSLSSTTGVPSERDLYELGEHVNLLKAEKQTRLKKLESLKKELTTILEVTELQPETSLEKELLYSKECPSLSSDTFKLLDQMVTKTKNKKAELEKEKYNLTEKLLILWDRLNINKAEREIFLSRHNDCRMSSINAIKQEINRCEEIKRQNIKVYICGLKKELEELWEKCFVCGSYRKFSGSDPDEVSEDLLDAYDKEVAKWRQFYKDVEHIIVKIEKRLQLWDLMIVFENKANDPNRFKNRRGNLLQEERERKKLQKDLPTLENEIFQDIEAYEEAQGKPFLYFGEDFRVFVSQQWEERLAQKENEKKERQKLRTKQIESEITLGTTSAKRNYPTTPKSAPSKLFKSTLGVPIYRTPGRFPSKPIPNTVSKMKTITQSPILRSQNRKVLGEKNQIPSTGSSSGLDETTYSRFASKLNSSSRKSHRSSVLSSRKIVGTRMSASKRNKSVNKSSNRANANKSSSKANANKSSSKASAIKSNSRIMTPARGKLGIPFLI